MKLELSVISMISSVYKYFKRTNFALISQCNLHKKYCFIKHTGKITNNQWSTEYEEVQMIYKFNFHNW